LRLCRETSSSDAILRALLRAKEIFGTGVVERLFILAFLPSMHASLRQVAKRYPQLSADDASQQVLQSLLRFLDSEQLRARRVPMSLSFITPKSPWNVSLYSGTFSTAPSAAACSPATN
jgi:hypothetical protein